MRVQVAIAGQVLHTFWVDRPIHIGRASSNDVVLFVDDVSGHHVVLYPEAGRIWANDLGSSNGSFVDGKRIAVATVLTDQSTVRLGASITISPVEGPPAVVADAYRLERIGAPIGWPIHDDVLAIPDSSGRIVADDVGWWLERSGERTAIVEEQPFQMDDVQYRIARVEHDLAPTRQSDVSPALHLKVKLIESTATLTHVNTQRTCTIKSELRSALLYSLGSHWLADRGVGNRGWTTDAELQSEVWGVVARRHGRNNLNVLLHRVRTAANRAGIQDAFLQRAPGQTRLHVVQVSLEN